MIGAAPGKGSTGLPSIGCTRQGFISDPVSKAKSVTFTEDGLREAERLFRELFAARG